MKKTVAIFFMGLYMLSFSEVHQLLRIPALVQHYIEHRQQEPQISLAAFLKMHYVHQYLKDEDYQRDNELPFRAADCCIVNASTLLSCECPYQAVVDVTANCEETQRKFVSYDEDNHSLLTVADIFQPPRCA